MTGTDRRDGGRRLVPMATVAVRPGASRSGEGGSRDGGAGSRDGGSGASVPRRARGLRRPASEGDQPTTARTAPAEHEDAVTDTLHRDEAVTTALHRGADTGLPTTPSRIPLPEAPGRSAGRDRRTDGEGDGRADTGDRLRQTARPAARTVGASAPTAPASVAGPTLAPPAGPTTVLPIGPPPAGRSASRAAGKSAADRTAPDRTAQADRTAPAARTPEAERSPSASAPTAPAPEPEPDDDGALGGLVPLSPGDAEPADEDTRRRRRLVWPLVAGVLVLGLAGGAFFARDLWGVFFPPDFAGPGSGHVVVQVADGDSTRDIGETLVGDGVVASARGFGDAAEDDPRGRGIQPGFYDMQRGMTAATAVDRMLDPTSRLGRLDVRGGTQLDDTAGAGTARVPGVLTLISQATCVVEDSGTRRCTSVDDLRRAMATTDPAQLGVPDWALDGVRRALPERRLEGLIAPGTYDVTPGTDAATALTTVVRTSAGRLEAAGIVSKASSDGVTPYQALVVASLAEREGVEQDFGKIARVVYNRLPIPMRLQLDSTINYPLDRQTLLTTPADRAAPGPYNTYVNFGLPPTPIGAVSTPALQAALSPDPGGWIYFVKCEPDGASCFAVTPADHDANRRLAQARGVY